jgi:two-component system, OmpR family, response regulator
VRVLVVEDSVKMAGLIKRGLEEQGFAVDVAATGQDAIWMAMEHEYDAIVLDVVLDAKGPGPDGFEVCRHLRDEGRWSPVLMLTARDAVEDRVRGLNVGADDYLTKPFSFQELLARLRALMRRGTIERPAELVVGDLRLEPATHRVRRGEERIDLTAKEFALLEYLMARAGDVIRRSDLIEHVWDFAFEGDSNVVDVHVRNLRCKIDRPFGRASLETVRGVGYRVRDERTPSPADQG